MTKEDTIIVPRWFLEVVEDTLRIEDNINAPIKKKTGESCQDRNIRQSLNGIRKLLKGEALTGLERLEPLQPKDETVTDCYELDEEIERIVEAEEKFIKFQVRSQLIKYVARHFAKWGAEHLKK